MSHTPLPIASASSSNFRPIFVAALNNYKRKTKEDLLTHHLTAQLQTCESPSSILDVLNQKYNIQQFIQSQSDGGGSRQWLNATVTVLCGFSAALGEGVGMVFSPAKVIFAGIGVFLITAKNVGASQDALIDLFDRIETFFERLETYVQVRLTEAMKNLIIKIMVEILGILAIATKEIKQRWAKRYIKQLVGRTDIEDALKRLEKLSHDECLTATVQVLEATERVVDATQQIGNDLGDLKRS
ncbi:hypothetical protein BJV78DRAFT_720780 [Lactifluus subvellereus]|nr:hypothetical protein BJV78DRAFT_720780 [Lactifluus subvellereus]